MALFRIAAFFEKLAVSVPDDRLRVRLNFSYHSQDIGDLFVERSLGAVVNVAVSVGGVVAVID